MADSSTPNLGLVKPGYDSPVDVAVINANMDKIDAHASQQSEQIDNKCYTKDNLTFDDAPVQGSTNPITSGGVYERLVKFDNKNSEELSPTIGSGITIHNLDITKKGTFGWIFAYLSFESALDNESLVASFAIPDGFEIEKVQLASVGKSASTGEYNTVFANVSGNLVVLKAFGTVPAGGYVNHMWLVIFK